MIEEVARDLKGSHAKRMVEAKTLTNWCFTARSLSGSKKLATKCERLVLVAARFKSSDGKCHAILGHNQHISSAEGYFWETSYASQTLTTASPRIVRDERSSSNFTVLSLPQLPNLFRLEGKMVKL